MKEEELRMLDKSETGRLWKKCVWKKYSLSSGTSVVGEGMQGISVLLMMKGTIQFFTKPDDKPFLLRKNDVCMLSYSPPYSVLVKEETHLLVCAFHLDIFPFDRDMLSALMPFYKKEEYDYFVLKMNEMTRSFAGLMDKYIQKGVESDLLFDVKRQEFFLLLFATYSQKELASFFYPIIGEGIRFKDFVIGNHLKAKNVQQLAKMANYSTSGFIKKFIRFFNESPYHWMMRHKAKIIFNEICTAQIPLKEIAFKYNFATYQHFREFCKKQLGVTPSQLQKTKKAENLVKYNLDKDITILQ